MRAHKAIVDMAIRDNDHARAEHGTRRRRVVRDLVENVGDVKDSFQTVGDSITSIVDPERGPAGSEHATTVSPQPHYSPTPPAESHDTAGTAAVAVVFMAGQLMRSGTRLRERMRRREH